MQWVLRLFAISMMLWAAPAHAQRVALVIGESSYRTVSPLANPGADANLVAAALARAGFDVRLGLDLDKAGLEAAIDDFAHDAQQADVAAVYYAGHGFEAAGRNWIVPVDAAISGPADLARVAVPFEAVARSLAGARVKIVALDACRDNPAGPEPVRIERRLICGGDTSHQRTAGRVVSGSGVQESDWGVPNLEGFRDGCLLRATKTPDWSVFCVSRLT